MKAALFTISILLILGNGIGRGQSTDTDSQASPYLEEDIPYAYDIFPAVLARIEFSRPLRDWDGFGFNYVETAQTPNYAEKKQEYGGFSLLDEEEKQEIIDMVFGAEGLKVGLVKMFLDSHHQPEPGASFDHQTTTEHMRYFVREGLKKTRADGRDLQIITTLYGPPGWATKQKVWRGRDLDPQHKEDVAQYMVDWVRFLKKEEGLPIRYLSLHNEGEDWRRWTKEGLTDFAGHDYNMYWPPQWVNEYLKILPPMLRKAGLNEVGVTNGENTNWYRFSTWGYADALYDDESALENLTLITSHGFYSGNYGRWFGEHKSEGIDMLREKRPELKAWVTSTSWSKMDAKNIKEMHGNIYTTKVNGIIPWAGIQRPPHWYEGDPNPGSAFTVKEDGSYEVRRGYYFYKQITRAGQPGMSVVRTSANDSEIAVIAFDDNGTNNQDAFVLINIADREREIRVKLYGNESSQYRTWRTTENEEDLYKALGEMKVVDGEIHYMAPAGSVTTFFAE